MARTVGIDLGTTNSLVAYLDPRTGRPECVPGPYGGTLCPSVVSLDEDGSIVVGDKVLIGKYSGTDIKIEDEEYTILREDEVLAIVE